MFRESWSYANQHTKEDENNHLFIPINRSSSISNKIINLDEVRNLNDDQLVNDIILNPNEEHLEIEDQNKRFTYCYLCSINAHVHKKTIPVPVHKRRYLKPYLNPVQLIKKYEKNQFVFENTTKYKFLIKTGSEPNSATDSTVWFTLYGNAGIWEQTELKNKTSTGIKFPSNSLVEIILEGPAIGELKKLKIWHNGKSMKDGWYLDYIEITCFKQSQTWRFVCDQWISIHRPPNFSNSVILTLNSNIFDNDKTRNFTEYMILIKTLNKPLSGNKISCQFQFGGSKHQSQVFNLLTPYVDLFDVNQLDCFMIMSSQDLGKPEKLKLAHNSRKMSNEWKIEFIKIFYSKEPNKLYIFKVDKWLDKHDKMNAIINFHTLFSIINEDSKSGKMIYHISVITGNSKNAGTDSKVYIQLKGTIGLSKIHILHNSKNKKEFERGKIDHFNILDDDIGEINVIKIWHDNSGVSPGWFLEAILIRSIRTKITGNETKHDSELFSQLERLRKKFKIKDMKLEEFVKSNEQRPKRSKSVELSRPSKANKYKFKKSPRSKSADLNSNHKRSLIKNSNSQIDLEKSNDSINYKNVLKKFHERSISSLDTRASQSILKTSASPRTRKEMMKKQVKFDSSPSKNRNHAASDTAKSDQKSPKIDMNINWVMSLKYSQSNSNKIDEIKTIENYDKSIKNIDSKLLNLYDSKMKKLGLHVQEGSKQEEDQSKIISNENSIYVFECNRWLSKDMDDKKIERVLKISNILRAK